LLAVPSTIRERNAWPVFEDGTDVAVRGATVDARLGVAGGAVARLKYVTPTL
jgi:hypothetical protein